MDRGECANDDPRRPRYEERVGAVERVMARNGLNGRCHADLHAQGEGIWIVLIGLTPAAFLQSFAAAAGKDAWKAVKRLYEELRDALDKDEDSHGQIYVREGGKTKEEWEASGRTASLPGLPEPDDHPPQIVIDSILPDEAIEALFRIDWETLEHSSFDWDGDQGQWVPRDRW